MAIQTREAEIIIAKNEVFFSENGLTSTSANHCANLAKEYIQSIEMWLEKVSFLNEDVAIIGSNEVHNLRTGWAKSDLDTVADKLAQIADAKSLIAWLREAIKAHDALKSTINRMSEDAICEKLGIELPYAPTQEDSLTEDEVIASFSVKERNEMYALQSKAAVLGSFVHPTGAYSKARKQLNDKLSNAKNLVGEGRDTLLYSYNASVPMSEVEDAFFKLQAKHREIQAQLNGYRHKIKLKIDADACEKNERYRNACAEYGNIRQQINAKISAYRMAELKKIEAYKIVIPNDLKPIYETINSLGK